MSKSSEVVLDHLNRLIPFGIGPSGGENLRVGKQSNFHEEAFHGSIRDATEESTERDGDEAEGDGNAPFPTSHPSNLEGSASYEYDEDLYSNLWTEC